MKIFIRSLVIIGLLLSGLLRASFNASEKIEFTAKQIRVPAKLGPLKLYKDREGFHVIKDKKIYDIECHFCPPILKKLSNEQLMKFVENERIWINQVGGDGYILHVNARIMGGGFLKMVGVVGIITAGVVTGGFVGGIVIQAAAEAVAVTIGEVTLGAGMFVGGAVGAAVGGELAHDRPAAPSTDHSPNESAPAVPQVNQPTVPDEPTAPVVENKPGEVVLNVAVVQDQDGDEPWMPALA